MLAPIYPPSAAAPLLFLALEKIARTPTPRLRVGYHVTSRYGESCIASGVKHDSGAAAPRLKSLRPLGQALYLDRLLAGGIVGDILPLSMNGAGLDTRPLANLVLDAGGNSTLGAMIDVWA